MIAEIAEENRNKLIPQHLQFPIVKYQLTSSNTPGFFITIIWNKN